MVIYISPPQGVTMSEAHTMTVRWTGDGVLAEAMAAAASEQGHAPFLFPEEGGTKLFVEVMDSDLQSLRDRVDALLVLLAPLKSHNGEGTAKPRC